MKPLPELRAGVVGRRAILAILAAAMGNPGGAGAQQQPPRVLLMGVGAESAPAGREQVAWIREGLVQAGLTSGLDLILELRWAEGDYARFPAMAAEAVAMKAAVVIVSTIAAAEAVRSASPTLPIVMMAINDPVGVGLAESLARPGGSITGMATLAEDVVAKAFSLMRSVLPEARRVTAILNPTNPSASRMLAALQSRSSSLGLAFNSIELSNPADLPKVATALQTGTRDFIVVLPDAGLIALSRQVSALTAESRLPVVSTFRSYAEAGALLSYGFKRKEMTMRAMSFVRRILNGARPADLPIEQPTVFETVINLRTARALGIDVPDSILAQADEVIE